MFGGAITLEGFVMKLYWKVFGIYFSAMFLSLGFIALLIITATVPLGETIRLDISLAVITAFSVLFAFAWIASIAKSDDPEIRILQLQELAKAGNEMFIETNPIGWLILIWRGFVQRHHRSHG